MSSEDLDKTVLVGPDASPDGADADPDATVLGDAPAEVADPDSDPDATQLADAAATRLNLAPGTHKLESLPTIVLPEIDPADPDDVIASDGIDALDDPYFSPAVPEDLTEAHAPVQIESPVQSLPERKKRMPKWAVALLVLVLLGAAGGAAWYTYQQEYWGGRTVPQVVGLSEEDARTALEAAGFNVVREFGGHGIGKEFHEDPFVGFTTEAPDVDTIMAPGMVFTIEPMVNAGAPDIKISKGDGWCVRTKDGSDSAQCEVQLVVTEDGYELLSW